MKPIRVLLIAPSLDIVGGQSVQAVRLLDAMRRDSGIQIDFLPTNPRLPGPLRGFQRIKYVRTAVTESIYTVQLLSRAAKYDILHVFAAGYSSYWLTYCPPALLSRFSGSRLILHHHDGRAGEHFERVPAAVRWAARADQIVVPSPFLVEVFRRHGLRACAIPNIVDQTQFCYRRRDVIHPRFLHNRGLEAHYNVPCTIRAFAAVQVPYPDASLVIAHDGPLKNQLQTMVSEMGLRNVSFAGAVSQERMRELYDGADIYLMSPDIDNMPLSVLECYASGLPVVSTAAGGVPYVVENERTGLLAPAGDHHALAQAALRLLQEPGLGLWLAKNARKECYQYQATTVASEWTRLYRTVLALQASESYK
jgi:glycosyltransferase involved in cell wall biosynthesis